MKKHLQRLLAFILVLILMIPSNAFAAETSINQSTKNNVDKIISYANQLRNASNSNSTTSGFVWDTEKKTYSWSYFNGLMMDAYMDLGGSTNFNFVDTFYNANISSDGSIVNQTQGKVSSGALDSCEPLRATFDLLRSSSRSAKYKSAIQKWYRFLEDQITYSACGGNFAHKQDNTTTVTSSWATYPIALDGLYMAQPFLMETANAIDAGLLTIKNKNNQTVSSSSIYNAVYNRFVWIYNNLYNSSTGLYDHGYNPSTKRTNGVSWSRSIGWYVMALVDVIEMMPEGNMKSTLISELPRIFDGLLRYQDASGLWYNVTAYNSSLRGTNQNILETSGSSMFAYAMVKATQNGYVTDSKYYDAAIKAFNGVVNSKLKGSAGNYSVVDTYKSSGASTDPAYYCNNSYTTDEAKGIGSLIMLAALLNNHSTVGSDNAITPDTPEQPVTTVSYEPATSITAGDKYIIASGNNGNVTIIGNNGSAFKATANVSNSKLDMSNKDVNQFLWTFNSASSGKISNNGLYVKTSSASQFNSTGEQMTISNLGNGAYQIKKTTSSGSTTYLNPNNLTSKTTSATTVYLFKEVVTTTQVPSVHEHTYEVVSETDGNCKTKGTKTLRCSGCQDEITEETVLGDHNYAVVSETEGNCITKGVRTLECTICGDTKTEETVLGDHNFVFTKEVPGDCAHKGYKLYTCSICGETKKEETTLGDHNFVFTKEVPGDCAHKGYKLYTCSICGETKKEETVLGDHNYICTDEIAGDCSHKGQKTYTCSICGETKTEETSYGDHNYAVVSETEGNCITKGVRTLECTICGDTKTEDTVLGNHNFVFTKEMTGDCTHKGYKLYTCSICGDTKKEETVLGDHNFVYTKEVPGDCAHKGYKLYTCSICGETKKEETTFGDHNFVFTKEVPGDCAHKGYKLYTCSICGETKKEETTFGDHDYQLIADVSPSNGNNGYKRYQCKYCNDTYDEVVEPEFEIIEETTTTITYEPATSITPGNKYIIASGNNGNVTLIGSNGSAFKATAYVSNRKLDMSNKNVNQFLWTFASATSGKISNNGLYVKTSSASQFNSTGEQMTITNLGNGAYQIKKTTSTGSTTYLNPNNLTSKTSSATTVYLFKEVVTTTVNRYEVRIEYEDVETTVYERATTIDTNSEYLMASGSSGNVKILGHTGYNVYNTDATVSNNLLTTNFSQANGNDANYLWKFSKPNTATGQTSDPVISNATSLGSGQSVSYIQNWDRNQIGAWGGGITVVNKGGYFTMKQWDNYIDAGSTQNSTTSKNIYLFKKTKKTEKREKQVLVKL